MELGHDMSDKFAPVEINSNGTHRDYKVTNLNIARNVSNKNQTCDFSMGNRLMMCVFLWVNPLMFTAENVGITFMPLDRREP